jgi:hypothetical protein
MIIASFINHIVVKHLNSNNNQNIKTVTIADEKKIYMVLYFFMNVLVFLGSLIILRG